MSRPGQEIGDLVDRWFEATNFSEEVKELAGALMPRINQLLHEHVGECKAIRVLKEDCFDSQLLALATVLKMHQEFEKDRRRERDV